MAELKKKRNKYQNCLIRYFFIFCVVLLFLDDSEERTRVTDLKCIYTVGKRDERRLHIRSQVVYCDVVVLGVRRTNRVENTLEL